MREGAQVPALAGVDVMTMPLKVARAYREDPASAVADQVAKGSDPTVSLKPGFTSADFNGATLWDLPEPDHCAVANLMARDVDALAPEESVAHFENENIRGFLPTWTVDEIDAQLADGKIPDYAKWKDRLRMGALGLDALMNMSALCAFASDQRALDDHIRERL